MMGDYRAADLADLVSVCGSPVHVLRMDRFERHFADFVAAFSGLYPRFRLAYSYKTNYIPELCARIDALGGLAEVVSEMEYELARRLGVAPSRIVFNGPDKSRAAIRRALEGGSLVNLESPVEVEHALAAAAARPDREFSVGLRVNFGSLGPGPISRFGFDVTGAGFEEALKLLDGAGNLRLGGLHCHYMVPGKSAAGFADLARLMLDLHGRICRTRSLDYIDMGGGFFSPLPDELAAQFPDPAPSFQDYARAVAAPFAEFFADRTQPPELILEPGIALAADALDYVCTVRDRKTVAGETFVQADGTIYDIKPTLNQRNLPLKVISDSGATAVDAEFTVAGVTCMEHDVLWRGRGRCPTVGDYLVFTNAGAYTVVLRPPFIRPWPALAVRSGDRWVRLRRAGRLADVFAGFDLPCGDETPDGQER